MLQSDKLTINNFYIKSITLTVKFLNSARYISYIYC